MKLRLRILLAMQLAEHPVSNDDIRQSIGRPAMPQCTVTWHLNELADLGAVESSRMHRYNRWSLTDYGRQLGGGLVGTLESELERKLAARKAPVPSNQMVRRALDKLPRTVFDLALMSATLTQRTHYAPVMQLALFEEKRH